MLFNQINFDIQEYLSYEFGGNTVQQYLIFAAYLLGSLIIGRMVYFILYSK